MNYILPLLVFVCFSQSIKAQNRASCILGDTLHLQMQSFRGSVQWQQSEDNIAWQNIVGEINSELTLIPQVNTKWIRAVITESDCEPYIESEFQVMAFDTASQDLQLYSLMNFEEFLLTVNADSSIDFNAGSNEFPFLPGNRFMNVPDINEQLLIVAIIEINGVVKVYTSATGIANDDLTFLFGEWITGRVYGQVLDEEGFPLAFAKVKIGNLEQLTDNYGVFNFDEAAIQEKVGRLLVSKDGYFSGSRTFATKNSGSNLKIRLIRKTLVASFNSPNSVSFEFEGVNMTIPSNAVSFNGIPFVGQVGIYANYINPEGIHFNEEMPGNLIASQNASLFGLTSFGMLAIEMIDSVGNELNLSNGSSALLNLPLSSSLQTSAPNTIDLWSYSEEFGYWINEGQANKQNNSYVAQIPHFSFWNCDIPWEAILLNGVVNDQDGNPISGVKVNISTANLGSSFDITNNNGEFEGFVPANTQLDLTITNECGNGQIQNLSTVLALGAILSDTTILVSDVSLTQVKSVHGRGVDCQNIPLESGYVVEDNLVHFLYQGDFSFLTCASNLTLRLITENPDLIIGSMQSFSIINGINNIGDINTCLGDTLFTSSVIDINGNVYVTVLIGSQWWMAENLKASSFADGSSINYLNSPATFEDNIPYYFIYENNIELNNTYGKLYNQYAVADSRNICPVNWHVASDNDWKELELELGMSALEIDLTGIRGEGEGVGRKLRTPNLWEFQTPGTVNEFGFTALPGGWANLVLDYNQINIFGFWWTSTQATTGNSYYRNLTGDSDGIFRQVNPDYQGMSVRCVKD
ncbi:MAG: FISUMP domain-containing protein [Bacteroidia bacterium]